MSRIMDQERQAGILAGCNVTYRYFRERMSRLFPDMSPLDIAASYNRNFPTGQHEIVSTCEECNNHHVPIGRDCMSEHCIALREGEEEV